MACILTQASRTKHVSLGCRQFGRHGVWRKMLCDAMVTTTEDAKVRHHKARLYKDRGVPRDRSAPCRMRSVMPLTSASYRFNSGLRAGV